MTKLLKFFLTVSLTAFAVGTIVCFTNIHLHPSWMVAMPIGAIFFGLFFSAYMLQGEMAKFDEETRLRFEWAKRHAPPKTSGGETRSERCLQAAGSMQLTIIKMFKVCAKSQAYPQKFFVAERRQSGIVKTKAIL